MGEPLLPVKDTETSLEGVPRNQLDQESQIVCREGDGVLLQDRRQVGGVLSYN